METVSLARSNENTNQNKYLAFSFFSLRCCYNNNLAVLHFFLLFDVLYIQYLAELAVNVFVKNISRTPKCSCRWGKNVPSTTIAWVMEDKQVKKNLTFQQVSTRKNLLELNYQNEWMWKCYLPLIYSYHSSMFGWLPLNCLPFYCR